MREPRRHLWRPLLPATLIALVLHAWLLKALAREDANPLPQPQAPALRVRQIHAEPSPQMMNDAIPPSLGKPEAALSAPTQRAAPPPARERVLSAAAGQPPAQRVPQAEPHEALATDLSAVGSDAAALGDAALRDASLDGTMLASNEEAAAAVPNLAPAPAHPPPVYPTRIPPTTTLSYELKRGFLSGSGELRWSNLGQRYQLSLEGRLPIIGTLLTQRSSGGFDNAGLAPERFTEKRRGRSEQAANLQRSAGIVSFSGPSNEYPLLAGTQDRLSWMVQMAAIAEAWKHVPPAGERLYCFIVGARGDGDVWVFSVEGQEVITTALGELRAVKLMRVPREPHDTKVEVWLDPSRHHLPARVRLTESSGDPLELSLQATSPPP